MSYRKFKADYLFDGYKMRHHDKVLIIHADGTIEDIVDETQAGGDLEKFPGMISPGFINCHCHLELSHLKSKIPQKQGLVNFVMSVVTQRNQSEEQRREAIRSAEDSMLDSGIVAVGDICNNGDTRYAKQAKRLDYYNFIELLGWNPQQALERYEASLQLSALFSKEGSDSKLFSNEGSDTNHVSISPHAPYSVSEELWNLMMPGFKNKTITIHNQESAAENEFFRDHSGDLFRMYERMKIPTDHFKSPGLSSLSYYLPKLKGAAKILLVHNTYTEEADILKARAFSDALFFCFCPNANLYIEDRLPDIPAFVKNKTRIVLGTDSLASNHQLSILEEMKTIKMNFPSIPTAELLVWATSNGAEALSFEKTLGSFSKGKKPGVVLIGELDHGEIGAKSTSRRLL
jgi:cytosine/adenosine deaminase-related metal-dependent hydrolase